MEQETMSQNIIATIPKKLEQATRGFEAVQHMGDSLGINWASIKMLDHEFRYINERQTTIEGDIRIEADNGV